MQSSSVPDATQRLQITCRNCSFNQLCIPRGLAQEEIERISGIVARRKILRRGEFLYRKGDRFRGIFAIKAGTAKMITLDLGGNEFMTGFLLPGELFGFDALASDCHAFSVVALETLSFCELPADQLDTLYSDSPNLLKSLFRHAGDSLTSESRQFVLLKRPAEERVAGFLLNLSERMGRRGFSTVDFRLSLTRQEIGNYLGLALETVSRILTRFEEKGLITVNHKYIHIASMSGLRCLCAHH